MSLMFADVNWRAVFTYVSMSSRVVARAVAADNAAEVLFTPKSASLRRRLPFLNTPCHSRGTSSFCHFCCWKRVCAHGQTARGVSEAEGADPTPLGEGIVGFVWQFDRSDRGAIGISVGQEQCKRNAKAVVECRESRPTPSRMQNSFEHSSIVPRV